MNMNLIDSTGIVRQLWPALGDHAPATLLALAPIVFVHVLVACAVIGLVRRAGEIAWSAAAQRCPRRPATALHAARIELATGWSHTTRRQPARPAARTAI